MQVSDYMQLPYTKIVQEINDEAGHYFYGKVLELDGCQSDGATPEELLRNLRAAMSGWLEMSIANNLPIPEPSRLSAEAQREGVSLSQYALFKLAPQL